MAACDDSSLIVLDQLCSGERGHHCVSLRDIEEEDSWTAPPDTWSISDRLSLLF